MSLRIKIAEFLQTMIYENKFIFIDLWYIIHLLSRTIIMFILIKFKNSKTRNFLFLLSILIIWELFELTVINTRSTFFAVEKTTDTIWDILFGLIGGLITLKFLPELKP